MALSVVPVPDSLGDARAFDARVLNGENGLMLAAMTIRDAAGVRMPCISGSGATFSSRGAFGRGMDQRSISHAFRGEG
jgi:hypothetical protein